MAVVEILRKGEPSDTAFFKPRPLVGGVDVLVARQLREQEA